MAFNFLPHIVVFNTFLLVFKPRRMLLKISKTFFLFFIFNFC